ncbi:MAG: response regulator transcription factor [Candidatus Taylorbacteria bacterium]|nr:response regulator transcription factor [Candidatus Taylorbacteria bacterium]
MRILIVEDDDDIVELLKIGLVEDGFVVDIARTGEKGSYVARTNEYDLILLDNMLPGKNGYQICKELRSSGNNTPIIIVSVQAEINDKIALLECGADDYVTKPFSLNELIARIRTVLRRPTKIESEILNIDDLTLQSSTQQVLRGKKIIYLTRKEFLLLEFLLKNKGNVVSRGMIMDHVWNAETDPFSNTLEAHILNLRKKIDIGGKRKLIHAIPGRGYKIDTHK